MIVDKEQINEICKLTEELSDKIKSSLTDDEMRFFNGFVLYNIKTDSDYTKVRIDDSGDFWVDGYLKGYTNFINREVIYINSIRDIKAETERAIKKAKKRYKKSLGEGAIIIKELKEIIK